MVYQLILKLIKVQVFHFLMNIHEGESDPWVNMLRCSLSPDIQIIAKISRYSRDQHAVRSTVRGMASVTFFPLVWSSFLIEHISRALDKSYKTVQECSRPILDSKEVVILPAFRYPNSTLQESKCHFSYGTDHYQRRVVEDISRMSLRNPSSALV